MFDRLESTGLSAKPSKCSICLPEQPFLGFVVDGDTRRPDPEKVEWIKDKIKLGRIGEVEDIMGAVLFLASDASALITGTSILVDGGWTAG